MGKKNDLVVDNINKIKKIYGFSDGKGDIETSPNNSQKKKLNYFKRKLIKWIKNYNNIINNKK